MKNLIIGTLLLSAFTMNSFYETNKEEEVISLFNQMSVETRF